MLAFPITQHSSRLRMFYCASPDLEPDIIIYHAINDVGVRMTDPEYFDGLNTGIGYWHESDLPLPFSVLYSYAATQLRQDLGIANELGTSFRRPEGIRSCEPDTSGVETYCKGLAITERQVLQSNPPIYFERNLRNMIALARSMDMDVLLLDLGMIPC